MNRNGDAERREGLRSASKHLSYWNHIPRQLATLTY